MRDPHRNHGCRLRDFVWRGQRCVALENRTLRAVFAATKGCDLIELTHKPTDTELLLQTDVGLPHADEATSGPLAVGAFRDRFAGGWYLMLPNGPEPCEHRGAVYGQHGEATFAVWDVDVVEDRAARVVVRFSTRLRRTPLSVERTVTIVEDGATLVIDEAVRNDAPQPVEVLWGQHPTFGAPFLAPGCRIDLPAARASTPTTLPADAMVAAGATGRWPHLPGRDGTALDLSLVPEGDLHDFVRIDDLAAGWFALRNPARGVGLALRWDEALFPVLGCWRLLGGGPDYPWYNRYRALALEPACDLPSLASAAAAGTAITLAAYERRATQWEATLFVPDRAVRDVAWGGAIR